MKKLIALLLALSSLAAAPQAPPPARRPAPPEIRLVLLIAVDQFRYDYLTRFRNDFTSGFKKLLTDGRGLHRRQSRALPDRHGDRARDDADRGDAERERHHRQRLVRSGDQGAGAEHHRHDGEADRRAGRGDRLAAAAPRQHRRRRIEAQLGGAERIRERSTGHRHVAEGSVGDHAGGPWRGCGVLVGHQVRRVRVEHLLHAGRAGRGSALSTSAISRMRTWARNGCRCHRPRRRSSRCPRSSASRSTKRCSPARSATSCCSSSPATR